MPISYLLPYMSSEDHTNEQIIQAINDGHNRYSLLLKRLKISETSLKYRLKKLKQAKRIRSYLSQDGNKVYYTKKQWWNIYFWEKMPSRRNQLIVISSLIVTIVLLALRL